MNNAEASSQPAITSIVIAWQVWVFAFILKFENTLMAEIFLAAKNIYQNATEMAQKTGQKVPGSLGEAISQFCTKTEYNSESNSCLGLVSKLIPMKNKLMRK